MPKNRSTLYTVVREELRESRGRSDNAYSISAIVGTFVTLRRAEEVAAGGHQTFIDAGADEDQFIFTVHPTTFYDE